MLKNQRCYPKLKRRQSHEHETHNRSPGHRNGRGRQNANGPGSIWGRLLGAVVIIAVWIDVIRRQRLLKK
jgi:hypothetical protein